RSRSVRGSGVLRPSRAGAAPDGRTDRAIKSAAFDVAGCAHAADTGGRTDRVQSLASTSARNRGHPQLSWRNSLRITWILTAFSLDARAQAARLPALCWRERQDGERGPDVRPRTVANRSLPRSLSKVLRGKSQPLVAARTGERPPIDTRHDRILHGLRCHPDPRRERRDHDRHADFSRCVIRPWARRHPEYSALGEQRVRAGAVSP